VSKEKPIIERALQSESMIVCDSRSSHKCSFPYTPRR